MRYGKTDVEQTLKVQNIDVKTELDKIGVNEGNIVTNATNASTNNTNIAENLNDSQKNLDNIMVTAFRIAVQGSLTQQNMVDGVVDEYQDEDGIDNVSSLNESYDSDDNFYQPAGAGPQNMTLISEDTTAESEPDTGRIIILEEDIDSITLNTDLKAYASRDNGSTWAEITLSDIGNYEGPKQILAGNADFTASGIGSGTSLLYKIETANNKNLKVHGVGLSWD